MEETRETIEQRVARIELLLTLMLEDNPMYVPANAQEKHRLIKELREIVWPRPTPSNTTT